MLEDSLKDQTGNTQTPDDKTQVVEPEVKSPALIEQNGCLVYEDIPVRQKYGIYGAPAAFIIKEIMKHRYDVFAQNQTSGGDEFNARSIMSWLCQECYPDMHVRIRIEGTDEPARQLAQNIADIITAKKYNFG